jgi:hypothetical protein
MILWWNPHISSTECIQTWRWWNKFHLWMPMASSSLQSCYKRRAMEVRRVMTSHWMPLFHSSFSHVTVFQFFPVDQSYATWEVESKAWKKKLE